MKTCPICRNNEATIMYPHEGFVLWLCQKCVDARQALYRMARLPSVRERELLDMFHARAETAVRSVFCNGLGQDPVTAAAEWAEDNWT